jgi:transcriptional regulator with XRE-family HTH domain
MTGEVIMATVVPTSSGIAVELERRRKRLGMSRQILARRSGVSLPTVNRALSNGPESERASYATLRSIAGALGMGFELRSASEEQKFKEQQALVKAKEIARMVQGTSALEAQAVDEETYMQIIDQAVHELMAGSSRRLWS